MEHGRPPRIANVDPAAMTEQQRAAARIVESGPRGEVRGPFALLLNSPGLFTVAQSLGTYLRFESSLPAKVRELAILVTARHWRQDYEWRVHSAIARESGVGDALIESARIGADLIDATNEETAIYAFCRQLHERREIDDPTYRAVQDFIGEEGVIDLCAVCGYYALLAMTMNTCLNPQPDVRSQFE